MAADVLAAPSATRPEMGDLMLRALLEALPDIVYFKDRESRFLAVSRPKAARHGFNDPDELIGKSDADLFGSEHADRARRDEVAILESGLPVVGKVERLVWPDGRESWVVTSKFPLREERGSIIGTFGITRDVTGLREMEGKLNEARDKLAAASEDSIKAELATGVLHDVNNAITAADFNTGFLIGELEKLPDDGGERERLIEAARSVKECIGHMTAVIRSQQTFAKLATDAERIDPGVLVQDALRITAAPLRRAGIEWESDLPAVGSVRVSRHAVLQILANMLLNARDALAPQPLGGRKLTLRTRREGGRVRIEVTDSGVGIAPENRARLFSRGFTTRADGHGFGLHSSRQAAIAMGGDLTATSAGVGQGATFTLELPAVA